MKKQILSILMVAMALPVMVFGADKLGVAEPISKGALKAEEVGMLWSMLESSIQSEKYTVITRSSLQQMMTEIGLTTSSDLLNMNTNQKAKLGMIEGVKYLLVSEVGTFGTRINCTLRVIDSSTGEVIPCERSRCVGRPARTRLGETFLRQQAAPPLRVADADCEG